MIAPDYILERQNNRKMLLRWKVAAFVAFLLALFAITGSRITGSEITDIGGDYIGYIRVDGAIMPDSKRSEMFDEIVEDKKIKALVVYINSPGGAVTASESLYLNLREVAKSKPVVAVMEDIAASGGYMAALGADYIVGHNSTLTGSIGVLWQNTEITSLAEKAGVGIEVFKTGALKAAPSMLEKVTPEVRDATMRVIQDAYDYFVGIVAQRRNMSHENVIQIADGRVYTGRQAYALGLIDKVGTIDDALNWLKDEHKINTDLKLKNVAPRVNGIFGALYDDSASIASKLFVAIFGSQASHNGLMYKM